MKSPNKISAQEYLQKMIHSSEPDLELFPIFKMHFSRLLDPAIVSIRLNDDGILINRQVDNDSDYEFGTTFTEERYTHFYSAEVSSKEIFDGIIYDKDPDQYHLLPDIIGQIDDSKIEEYQLFGDFKLAYQLIKNERYFKRSEEELDEKLDQLNQSVEESIDISHSLRYYLIEECVQKVISRLKNELSEKEQFASLYDELIYEYQNMEIKNFSNEPDQFCKEVFDELSDTKKKAIEYSLADMKRIDVRQEGHYDFHISDQVRDSEKTFIDEILFEVNHHIYQSN